MKYTEKKKIYEDLDIELIVINNVDVISTSNSDGEDETDTDTDPNGWVFK